MKRPPIGSGFSTAAASNRTTRATLMTQPDIDGALVGGASLDPRSFAEIVKAARDEVEAIDLNRQTPVRFGEWSRREPSDMDGIAREGERAGASESTVATS